MFDTEIPLYGILLIISIFSGLIVVYKNVSDLNKDEKLGFIMYLFLGTLFGSKIFTFIIDYKRYSGVFDFSKIGFSSYGAIFGIIVMIFLFSIQFKREFKTLFYSIIPAIPLMYGIGKIGCFLAGCCYGIEYSGLGSVIYRYSRSAPNGVGLFPVQLVEAIVFLIIYVYVSLLIKKKKINDCIVGKIFLLCGLAKFTLDFLRDIHVNIVISINQYVSLLFIVIGIVMMVKYKLKKNKNNF